MTTTEKYLAMNNTFCKLRDAIYYEDVEEMEEDVNMQKNVELALGVLCNYLDYYKQINDIHTKEKE